MEVNSQHGSASSDGYNSSSGMVGATVPGRGDNNANVSKPTGHPSAGAGGPSSNRDSFSLRPTFMQKFRPQVATKFMQQILQNHLQNKTYNAEECQQLSKVISEEIKEKLIELDLSRYKYIVNVVMAESLGEGARMDTRCYWDQESDGSAHAFFKNDSLWCAAVAFAVFYY